MGGVGLVRLTGWEYIALDPFFSWQVLYESLGYGRGVYWLSWDGMRWDGDREGRVPPALLLIHITLGLNG